MQFKQCKKCFPQLIKSIAFFHIYNSEITTDSETSSNPLISIVLINMLFFRDLVRSVKYTEEMLLQSKT